MKDWYMIFALLAVIATPLFPILLKSKCPRCSKRKLEHLESVHVEGAKPSDFYTYYKCRSCETDFRQKRSGKLEPYSVEQPSPIQAIEKSDPALV